MKLRISVAMFLAVCVAYDAPDARAQSVYRSQPSGTKVEQTRDEEEQLAKQSAQVAVSALTMSLRDPEPGIRQASLLTLREIGPAADPAIPVIADLVHDPDSFVRIEASRALVNLAPTSEPALIGLLRDPDCQVRELAARSLEQIDPPAVVAIPALTERLRDFDPSVRQASLLALRQMGTAANSSIPQMTATLNDPDSFVRVDASHNLVKLGAFAVPSVSTMLRHPNPVVRLLAAQTLEQIAAEADLTVRAQTK